MAREERAIVVDIESLAAGGDGVARVDGKVCFVPFSVPGDRLLVRVAKEKRSAMWGRLVQIERPSELRREPVCPRFGTCGGCVWMNVEYAAQLEAKREIVARSVGVSPVDIFASPLALGYRRLARLHVDSKRRAFGFVAADPRAGIVDVEDCPVMEPRIARCLAPLRGVALAHLAFGAQVRLTSGADSAGCVVDSDGPLTPGFYEACAGLVPEPLAAVVAVTDGVRAVVAGEDLLETAGGDGRPLRVPAGGFGQANDLVNRELAATVASWLAQGDHSDALELFAGAGNLSVALAPSIARLETGEMDETACAAAARNLAERGLSSVRVHRGEALDLYMRHGRTKSAIVLDPPRTGHAALAAEISRGRHRAVVYVSCDPATLGRDLGILATGGFKVVRARAFDMFPQTPHVETAVLLERG